MWHLMGVTLASLPRINTVQVQITPMLPGLLRYLEILTESLFSHAMHPFASHKPGVLLPSMSIPAFRHHRRRSIMGRSVRSKSGRPVFDTIFNARNPIPSATSGELDAFQYPHCLGIETETTIKSRLTTIHVILPPQPMSIRRWAEFSLRELEIQSRTDRTRAFHLHRLCAFRPDNGW